ncbi:MAG: sugar phosphate isomerase/epimerase [Clostridia bacterium]|nr:sugar phosphate isomerase/epimerase [Clostridia bacterium]
MEYGVQLYSVRDSVADKGMKETLRRVAEIGYSFVEFAGFGDLNAEEIRACLDEFGLKVSGTHTSINALLPDRIDETIADMKVIGNKNLIIPGVKIKTAGDIREFLDQLAQALPKLRAAGIEVGFHNHHKEFLPNEDGIYAMDVFKKETDIFFELDTYWAFHAGVNPIEEMDRMGERLRFIHIKDGIPSLGTADGGRPLGRGEAPVAAVYKTAVERGLPLVVESETLNPDGMTEIKICYDYLKSLEI